MKRKVILFVLGVLFLAGCAPLSDSVWAPPAALPPGTPLDLNLTAGTFTGSAVSWEGALLTLEVDVDTSRILDINIVNHGDTPLFAYMAFNAILPSIIESNSTGVSTISGATTTSLAVLRAVEEAMEQAGADLAVLRTWIPTVVPGNYYPGVYLGVGTGGFGGNIYVEVTFDEESITHIQVVSHSESPGFGNSALNHLIDQVLFRQSLDVDVVTNGTVTTHAFLAAVAQTIEQATIEPEPEIGPVAEIILPEPEDEVDEPEDEPEELAEEPEDEPADEPEDEAEEPADEPEDEPAVEPEPTVPATRFTAGTFTGSGTGYYGPGAVRVTIVVDADNIINITMDTDDTPLFAGMAADILIPAALAAQGADIATVGGATSTSEGFIQALQNALNQAEN